MLLAGNSTSPVYFRRRRILRLPALSKSSANCCTRPSSGSSNKNTTRAEPTRPRIKVIAGKTHHHPPVRIPPRTSSNRRQRGIPPAQDQPERLSKAERFLGITNAARSEGCTETTTEPCQNELTIAVPRPSLSPQKLLYPRSRSLEFWYSFSWLR
jgi:hypothetical protein